MAKNDKRTNAAVKIYNGYGKDENLVIYGHVLKGNYFIQRKYTRNAFINIINIFRLFFIRPIPNVKVKLNWKDQIFYATTEKDGFFTFEWKSDTPVLPGWHDLTVDLLDKNDKTVSCGNGKVLVPNATQYAFVSDIDDTVLISHSGRTRKKLWSMLTKNPRSRKTFVDVVNYYNLLSNAHTEKALPNPFFYVSSSEWNLYEYLCEFFNFNELPDGVFLLSSIKKWYQLFKSGNTKHLTKFNRISRLLEVFPNQKFILLGDNSQSDPEVYRLISAKYPNQIFAVYIRNINPKKELFTEEIFRSIENKAIFTLQYIHTNEAILHSRSVGLL